MSKANYTIVSTDSDIVLIEDIGPHDKYQTVTNDAEGVVAELHQIGVLGGKQLHYFDSDGQKDKLMHDGAGNFTGFASL